MQDGMTEQKDTMPPEWERIRWKFYEDPWGDKKSLEYLKMGENPLSVIRTAILSEALDYIYTSVNAQNWSDEDDHRRTISMVTSAIRKEIENRGEKLNKIIRDSTIEKLQQDKPTYRKFHDLYAHKASRRVDPGLKNDAVIKMLIAEELHDIALINADSRDEFLTRIGSVIDEQQRSGKPR